jgi:RNA recognition motif-containing protein
MAASPARERSPGAAPNTGGPNATVYVGNLSGDTERDQLREAMTTFGRVATATVRAATLKPSACPAAPFQRFALGIALSDARAAVYRAGAVGPRE